MHNPFLFSFVIISFFHKLYPHMIFLGLPKWFLFSQFPLAVVVSFNFSCITSQHLKLSCWNSELKVCSTISLTFPHVWLAFHEDCLTNSQFCLLLQYLLYLQYLPKQLDAVFRFHYLIFPIYDTMVSISFACISKAIWYSTAGSLSASRGSLLFVCSNKNLFT